MSLRNYYTILNKDIKGQQASYLIELNAAHEIFKGHFPDFPLLPGVVQIELLKDLLERSIGETLELKEAKNIKYLGMIDPKEQQQLKVNIAWTTEAGIKIKAQILSTIEPVSILLKYSALYEFKN